MEISILAILADMAVSKSICGANLHQIHVVFDRYLTDIIKASTREKRALGRKGQVHHVTLDGVIPNDWSLFLTREENKQAIAKLFTGHIIQHVQIIQNIRFDNLNNLRAVMAAPKGKGTSGKIIRQVSQVRSFHLWTASEAHIIIVSAKDLETSQNSQFKNYQLANPCSWGYER